MFIGHFYVSVNFLFMSFSIYIISPILCYTLFYFFKYKGSLHRKDINPLQCHILFLSLPFVFIFIEILEHGSFCFLCGFVCFDFNGWCLWHAWEGLCYPNFKQTDIHLVFPPPAPPPFFSSPCPYFRIAIEEWQGPKATYLCVVLAPGSDLSVSSTTSLCHAEFCERHSKEGKESTRSLTLRTKMR